MSVALLSDDQINRCEHVFSEPGFGAMSTDKGNLPLAALEVQAGISGLFARTTLKQTFINNLNQPLEATYIFPLPDRGAVVGFRMYVANRVVEGVIKERGQARRDYDRAISAGHRASIVEEERPDTFTMRVGNIAPGENATVELELIVPLLFHNGEATFRFPLVVAPRYIPGSPLDGDSVGDGTSADTNAVPDASRITPPVLLPGFKSRVRLGIEVSVDHAGLASDPQFASSLHAVTQASNDQKTLIRIQPGERVNRDFILRFKVAQEKVRSTFTTIPDAKGDGATFLLTLVPPTKTADQRRPRDIVFVLDRSGSMSGWKMVAARRAVGRMIDTLDADDSFQVLAFDDRIEKPELMSDQLIEASNRNRYRVVEWLSTVDARGGTEMADPIYDALGLLTGGYSERDRYVVLVTDGQVGNEDQILKGVHKRNRNAHIFTVGIDQAVNAGFLNRLAETSGGRCELVESEDRLDGVMDKLHRMIDTPVLNEVTVTVDGANIVPDSLVPERPMTLFAAAPLTLAGRLTGKGCLSARVRGITPGQVLYEETVKAGVETETAFSAVWARAKIRSLEDAYAAGGHRGSLAQQITDISLQHKVLCRFTSFVAVDETEKVKGELEQVVQPVEAPEGWGGGGPGVSFNQAAPMGKSAPMPVMARMAAPAPPPSMSYAPQADLGGMPQRSMARHEAFDDDGTDAEVDMVSYAQAYDSFADEMLAEEAPMPMPARPVDRAKKSKEVKGGSSRGHGGQTRSGTVRGDFARLSPEAVRGLHLSKAHDVFVLALLWIELLTGKKLFAGMNDLDTVQAIANWQVAHLPAHLDRWRDVLEKALAEDPRDRFEDAEAFADAVIELAEDLGVSPAPYKANPLSQTNRSFGAYALTTRISTGAGFEIWAGARSGKPRVVRIWDASRSSDPDFVDSVHEEVRVDAPFVLPLAEFGVEDGCAYVAYEGDARGGVVPPVDEPVAFKAILSMSAALQALHASDVALERFTLADAVVLNSGEVALAGLGAASRGISQTPGLLDRIQQWFKGGRREFWK